MQLGQRLVLVYGFRTQGQNRTGGDAGTSATVVPPQMHEPILRVPAAADAMPDESNTTCCQDRSWSPGARGSQCGGRTVKVLFRRLRTLSTRRQVTAVGLRT